MKPTQSSLRGTQFGVRLILLVITAICVWLGCNVPAIHERQIVRQLAKDAEISFHDVDAQSLTDMDLPTRIRYHLSLGRRMLGDQFVESTLCDLSMSDSKIMSRIKRAFPEAKQHYSCAARLSFTESGR